MTECDVVDYCTECDNLQVFTTSGSGKKAFCDGCELSFVKVGKSFRRVVICDEW